MDKYKPMIGDRVRVFRCAARGDVYCNDGEVVGIESLGMIRVRGYWDRRKTDHFPAEIATNVGELLVDGGQFEPRGDDDA